MKALDTARLVLEPQVAAHAGEMYAVLRDPAIYEFENAPPASADALRERFRKLESRRSPDGRQAWLNWVVFRRVDGTAMGYVQATVLPERDALIAYEFGSAWWGQGFASEAVRACLDVLRREYGVRRAGAVFKRTNHRSRRLLVRLGMRSPTAGEFPSEHCGEDEEARVIDLPGGA